MVDFKRRICVSCPSPSQRSHHEGFLQILTQVDRLSKHQAQSLCQGHFYFRSSSLRPGPRARMLESLAESSRMWLWFCPAVSSGPRASPSSCQQALEAERKRVALPPTSPACLLSLQGLKGGMGAYTETHKQGGNHERFLSTLLVKLLFKDVDLMRIITLMCCLPPIRMVSTVDGSSKALPQPHLAFLFPLVLHLLFPTSSIVHRPCW